MNAQRCFNWNIIKIVFTTLFLGYVLDEHGV